MRSYLGKCLMVCIALAVFLLPLNAFGAQSDSSDYRLRPGDTLEIIVSGEQAYSGSFPLATDGTVLFSDEVVGKVALGGRTPEEAKVQLVQTLSQYLKDPIVSLRISKFRVSVAGDVKNPGSYETTAGETVMDAILRAGGANREVSLNMVEVQRAAGTKALLDLRDFLNKGGASNNLILQPGDEVLVGKSQTGQDYKVFGAVKFPSSYPLWKEQPTRISQAIEAAGHWTEDADPRLATLTKKDGRQSTIDLSVLAARPGDPNDVVLEPGDEIFVPRKALRILIQGAVNRPGDYLVEDGTTFFQAVGKAGGLKNSAILKDCCVVRGKQQDQWVKVDLTKFLNKGDMKANPAVQDGDTLWVAEQGANSPPKRDALGVIGTILQPLLWLLRF